MGRTAGADRYPDTGYGVKDTPVEINRIMFERVMAMSPTARLEMGFSMLGSAKELILAGLPEGISPAERRKRLFERLYGEPLPEECRLD